jgi:pSer/pThr/pTyr-binding forkhead associated (FHA) protein
MPARLVSLSGQPHITLEGVLIVVGRHQHCDVRISSTRISRKHCCLAIDGDAVVVRDLGSTNGTMINGSLVDVGVMHNGDELSLAHLRYRLEFFRSPGDTAPPATRIRIIENEVPPAPPTDLYDTLDPAGS